MLSGRRTGPYWRALSVSDNGWRGRRFGVLARMAGRPRRRSMLAARRLSTRDGWGRVGAISGSAPTR